MRDVNNPSGLVRVAMLSEVYHFFLSGVLARFTEQWPDINLHITLSDRAMDLLTEPYDLDIQVGPLTDSALIAKKIYTVNLSLYASSKLLQVFKMPQKPQDLRHWPCITLSRLGNPWYLSSGTRQEKVVIRPVHVLNSVVLLHELAFAGAGATLILPPEAVPHERAGKLVHLLPEWKGPSFDMHIIMMSSQIPRRVRVFVEFISDFFADLQRRADS